MSKNRPNGAIHMYIRTYLQYTKQLPSPSSPPMHYAFIPNAYCTQDEMYVVLYTYVVCIWRKIAIYIWYTAGSVKHNRVVAIWERVKGHTHHYTTPLNHVI